MGDGSQGDPLLKAFYHWRTGACAHGPNAERAMPYKEQLSRTLLDSRTFVLYNISVRQTGKAPAVMYLPAIVSTTSRHPVLPGHAGTRHGRRQMLGAFVPPALRIFDANSTPGGGYSFLFVPLRLPFGAWRGGRTMKG
jgi:hypothetical protein